MTPRTLTILLVSALTLGFSSPRAQAQASSSSLTRDELRQCMDQEDRIRTAQDKLQSEISRSNDEAAAIASDNAKLTRASANGFRDKASVDAHNAKALALQKRAVASNAKSRQLKLSLADIQSAEADFLRRCGGKSYYHEDKSAILAEREGAAKASKIPDPPSQAASQN